MIISILGIGVIYKSEYILDKIDIVDKGMDLYHKKHWIEAEACLGEAKAYTRFEYRDVKVEQLLNELSWITNYNETLKQICSDVIKGKQELDYDLFYSAMLRYQELDFDSLEEYQKNYYLVRYSLEATMDDAWMQFKEYMQNMLEQPTKASDYNWAKEHIFEIPDKYFNLPKDHAIQTLFETCDRQLYQNILIKTYDLEHKLDSLNEIYKINSQYGYQTEWLTPEITQYVRSEIEAYAQPASEEGLQNVKRHFKTSVREMEDSSTVEDEIEHFFTESKEGIKCFSQIVRDYKSVASHFYYDAEIEKIKNHYIAQKESEIQILLEAQYYDEAINWYSKLSDLKSFSQEINEIKKTRLLKDPILLIEDRLEDYAKYQVGWEDLDSERYMVAINNKTMLCEVYLLTQEEDYTRYHKFTFPLEEILGGDSMYHYIKENNDVDLELKVSKDLIGIKTIAENQEELVIFSMEENTTKNLLYDFGEKIEWDELMEEIIINQSYEKTEPLRIYHYSDGRYLKEEYSMNEVTNEELDANLKYETEEEMVDEEIPSYDLEGIICEEKSQM